MLQSRFSGLRDCWHQLSIPSQFHLKLLIADFRRRRDHLEVRGATLAGENVVIVVINNLPFLVVIPAFVYVFEQTDEDATLENCISLASAIELSSDYN